MHERLDLFTSDQQEMFFFKAGKVIQDSEVKSSMSDQNTHEMNNYAASKSQIHIDGVNYAFKHIIKGYVSPRTREMMKTKGKVNRQSLPKLNIERANQLTKRPKKGSLDTPGKLDSIEIDQFAEENSLYSEDDEISMLILTDESLYEKEMDANFKLNYGVIKEIPPSFHKTVKNNKISSRELCKVSFPSGKSKFNREFAGVLIKAYLNIKRPDKALIKKYTMKSDRNSSTNRSGTSDNNLRSSTGNLLKMTTNKYSWIVQEHIKDLQELEDNFEEFKLEQFKNRMLTKSNIK